MSGQSDPDSAPPSPARGIAGLIVANSSLITAVLVYMGWAYAQALYGYFHVSPLDLNVSVLEYLLHSLSLFSPVIVIAAIAFIAVAAAAGDTGMTKFAALGVRKALAHVPEFSSFRRWISTSAGDGRRVSRIVLFSTGAVVTITALVLAWIANYAQISTYLVLGLLGSGPLFLTRPIRAERRGRFPYALAIVTAVAVYSDQPLALSGHGVTLQHFPAGIRYHYLYEGLRLLITRSGTYYLLPVGWSPQSDLTYVLDQSDSIRIVLHSTVRTAS